MHQAKIVISTLIGEKLVFFRVAGRVRVVETTSLSKFEAPRINRHINSVSQIVSLF